MCFRSRILSPLRPVFLLLLLFTSMLIGTSASAQNLLLNGDFDTDLDPWTLGGQEFIEISWTSGDVDGSLVSGSLETFSQSGGPYQCVPVSGNSAYLLDGFVGPLSIGRTGIIEHTLSVEWFSSTNCDFGTFISFDDLPAATSIDAFERLTGTLVAPLAANSARVRLKALFVSGSFARALYDSVYLPEPTFGVGLGLGMVALLGLRRLA